LVSYVCASVNIPPALGEKAGIAVPERLLCDNLRMEASSAIARKTGMASEIAAPPSLRTVTAGAVLREEKTKIHDLVRAKTSDHYAAGRAARRIL